VTLGLLLALALGDPERATFAVDGLEREALVAAPAKRAEAPPPLVFAWHGHGGSMAHAARSFRTHELWPEAVVVYPQGLPTPGRLSDPEGKKPGWQHGAGEQGDRDLKFFDVLLAAMKEKHGAGRVFSMGHSNGGQFTYLLWASRPGLFTALGPSGAAGGRLIREAAPCPLLHVAGEKDPLVRFEWQKAGLVQVRARNACEETPKPWGPPGCEIYASSKGAPLVTFIHPGGHEYPKEAPELIVKFFKEHARKP
jgi:polyhydroxybutyrate depolymerase